MYIKTTGMILKIEPDKTIALIQQEFNTAFPFLKIEFLKNGKITLFTKRRRNTQILG